MVLYYNVNYSHVARTIIYVARTRLNVNCEL